MATDQTAEIGVQRSRDLAVEALERLSEIIRTLATKKKNPAMGRLSAEIFMTASYLKDVQSGQPGPLDKLPKLLKDLDRACRVSGLHLIRMNYQGSAIGQYMAKESLTIFHTHSGRNPIDLLYHIISYITSLRLN